jgi:hypothetical protein
MNSNGGPNLRIGLGNLYGSFGSPSIDGDAQNARHAGSSSSFQYQVDLIGK